MIRYWWTAMRAAFARGRALFALTVFGVALGIAAVLGIQILNRSALAAFRGAVQAVSGDADLTVLPRLAALPDSLYVAVLGTPGVAGAWPIYQVSAALAGRGAYYLDLVGVDFFAPIATPWSGGIPDVAAVLAEPGWAAIGPALARELGLGEGDRFEVSSGSRRATLRVGALVDFQRVVPLASRKLVVLDIAQAQHLLGGRGVLTQVDVRLAEGAAAPAVAARLAARLGPVAEVMTPEQRERRAEGLMRAFRLNLSALSLVSVVVGFFLVRTAMQAALVRRRREFGVLRASGAARAQVLGLIAADVALLGALGVAAGLPLGYLVARANLDVVSGTIANLYLLNEIERLDVPPSLAAGSAAVGLLAAVAGAVGPARDLARSEVRELLAPVTLHDRAATHAAVPALGALALLAGAAAWYRWFGHGWRPAGFVLAVAVLLAIPLATPWLLRRATRGIATPGFGLRYALRSLGAHLHTTGFAVAALGIAVAMLVGVTVMVGSFRRTVAQWVEGTLQADVYVTPQSWRGAGGQGALADTLVAGLLALEGVRSADRLRGFPVVVGERRVQLVGVDLALEGGARRFPLYQGDIAEALHRARTRDEVIITEPLARKLGRWVGDSLALVTPAGERRFRVAGVNYDYSSENGGIAMDLDALHRLFGPGPLNSVALYLEPGRDAEAAVDAVRARFPAAPLTVRSNRDLRDEVLRVFDQTFAVTRLLQVLALLVAATQITLTLLILARERQAELALYRALGAERRQVFRYVVGKGLGIGAGGLLLGAAGGLLLALVLILVINRAYFGWTIRLVWPWGPLGFAALTIVVVALAASLYPALRASEAPAAHLSRDDL